MTNNNQYLALNNQDLFKEKLEIPLFDILEKYSKLVHEYVSFICENIALKNKFYTRFIIIRGLDTITHVFTHILYYTKNIDLAYFHSQKSFYFYVEFIGQISNDQNTFLQLSSRDAVIYVYKKTLFEINNEYRKKMTHPTPEENEKYLLLNEYTKIYKMLCSKLLHEEDFLSVNEKKEKYLKELDHTNTKINELEMNKHQLDTFQLIMNKLLSYSINTTTFFECIGILLKKIKNKNICKEKLYCENFELYLNESTSKLIQWLFT
jgi:hypothetical protein